MGEGATVPVRVHGWSCLGGTEWS